MKQKLLFFASLTAILIAGLIPTNAFAASASVYVSPGSVSVTKGNNVTVSVRVNSGTNPMDSAKASLSFTSSRLQYVTYSAGSFSTFDSGISGSTFNYTGAIMGGSTSSDRLMFSVTFRAIASGTAYLSLSGVEVAYQGAYLDITGASGGSIVISEPPSSSTTPTPPSTSTSTPSTSTTSSSSNTNTATTSSSTDNKDTTPPKLAGSPSVTTSQSTISIKLKTDEKSKLQISYSTGKNTKTLNDGLSSSHSIIIGKSAPLLAGTSYQINIVAIDESGNKATIYKKDIKTDGVEYSVRITDSNGQPLANSTIELHSKPMTAITDSNGVATFNDVTPGEHTLVFTIDGLSMQQPVTIAQPVLQAGSQASNIVATIKLPVRFADENGKASSGINYPLLLLLLLGAAVVLGALIATIFKIRWFKNSWTALKNSSKQHGPADSLDTNNG